MKKTNTLTKLLALVLSLVMMCSMSVSAFAAEVVDVEYDQETENCEVITIDLDEILDDADIENLNARGNIVLEPSKARLYTVGTLSAGQSVIINVKWNEGTYPVHVGLVKSTSSTGNLVSLTGGSRSITATVKTAGTYYLMIANPSTTQKLTITTLQTITAA